MPGRVVAEHRDLYRVQAASGEVWAWMAGRLRYQAENRGDLPAMGDWVLLDAGEPGRRGRLPSAQYQERRGVGSSVEPGIQWMEK